jgi:hypothetical protein
MSILCFFGRHKASPVTMARSKNGTYVAICESCRRPLERQDDGSWQASEPLYDPKSSS